MAEKYKFNFTYISKDSLKEKLISLDSFKKIDKDGTYHYYNKSNKLLTISIQDDGLLVYNYVGKGWIFYSLESIIVSDYQDLNIFDITNQVPYSFEKLGINQQWIDYKLLTEDELQKSYIKCIGLYRCSEYIRIKYIKRWLKDKTSINDEMFHFLLPYFEELAFFIRYIPLSKKQLVQIEELSKNNKDIKNALLYKKILNKKLKKALIDEVLLNNDVDTVKALINQTNNHEFLTYILENNKLDSKKINNIIRKKLSLTRIYAKKTKKKQMDSIAAARIHILLAKDSSNALIIRRKPSKRMCTFLWDREKNTFKAGDCTARIEERLSDISDDGKYFYYFGQTQKGQWRAISHVSSLRNMIFYREDGFRCRDIQSSHPQYVYDLYEKFMKIHPYGDPHLNNAFPRFKDNKRKFKKEEWDICNITGIYYRRLLRDGWKIVHHKGQHFDKYACKYATYFEKELPNAWILKKIAHDVHPAPEGTNGGHWDEHMLVNHKNNMQYSFTDWDWSDIDNRYLYWTQKGILHRIQLIDVNSASLKHIDQNSEILCDLNTINIPTNTTRFNIDGDIHVMRGIRLEHEYKPNLHTLEYHYINSIDMGGIDACFYLGQIYLNKLKKLEKASYYTELGFNRAKEKNQLTYWQHEYYGDILFQEKNFEKAYMIFEASIHYTDEAKNKAAAYNYLGVISSEKEDKITAIEFFKKAISLDSDNELYFKNLNLIKNQ